MKPISKSLVMMALSAGFVIVASAGLLFSASPASAKSKLDENAYREYFNQEVLQLTTEQRAAIRNIVKN